MPNKNLVRLVEAFAQVRSRLPAGISLVLAGREVTGADEVREAVRGAGLQDAVRWLGYVPDGALPALYSAALAFCYPSLQEGFGLPVLEAMACGTPVVTSSSTALLEIARDAALLVDPYDVGELSAALVRAVTDAGLRAHLRDAGLERAASYTWEATARTLAEAYSRLLSR
jgi:glycosyltransferase involved in cell wall biosynthesis